MVHLLQQQQLLLPAQPVQHSSCCCLLPKAACAVWPCPAAAGKSCCYLCCLKPVSCCEVVDGCADSVRNCLRTHAAAHPAQLQHHTPCLHINSTHQVKLTLLRQELRGEHGVQGRAMQLPSRSSTLGRRLFFLQEWHV